MNDGEGPGPKPCYWGPWASNGLLETEYKPAAKPRGEWSRELTASHHLRPVLQRFRQVRCLDIFTSRQVRDRPHKQCLSQDRRSDHHHIRDDKPYAFLWMFHPVP